MTDLYAIAALAFGFGMAFGAICVGALVLWIATSTSRSRK